MTIDSWRRYEKVQGVAGVASSAGGGGGPSSFVDSMNHLCIPKPFFSSFPFPFFFQMAQSWMNIVVVPTASNDMIPMWERKGAVRHVPCAIGRFEKTCFHFYVSG